MTGWHVGMQVVCVDDAVGRLNRQGGLVKGSIYTISRIVANVFPEFAVQLSEFSMRDGEFMRASRFRPVRKTSIECLQSLLNPSPEEILAGTAEGNDYDVPSVAADERTSFLPGVSSRCLTARLLLSGGGWPSFLHRVTSRERLERLGSDEPGTAGARPLGGCGGGGEPPWCGDEHITTGDTRDVGILTRACG